MRNWLIDGPARAWDAICFGYCLLIAAGAVICLVSAALWLILSLASYPLP